MGTNELAWLGIIAVGLLVAGLLYTEIKSRLRRRAWEKVGRRLGLRFSDLEGNREGYELSGAWRGQPVKIRLSVEPVEETRYYRGESIRSVEESYFTVVETRLGSPGWEKVTIRERDHFGTRSALFEGQEYSLDFEEPGDKLVDAGGSFDRAFQVKGDLSVAVRERLENEAVKKNFQALSGLLQNTELRLERGTLRLRHRGALGSAAGLERIIKAVALASASLDGGSDEEVVLDFDEVGSEVVKAEEEVERW